MSSAETKALRAEIEVLRASIESIRLSVVEIRERLDRQEEARASAPLAQAPPVSSSGYSVVSESIQSSGGGGEPVLANGHEARGELARDTGRFLRRCLAVENRGSSGRSRLKLGSTLYLILADYHGNHLPPRAVRDFATAAAICKRGPSCGKSIFVGFATEWEAEIACEEVGVLWPGF